MSGKIEVIVGKRRLTFAPIVIIIFDVVLISVFPYIISFFNIPNYPILSLDPSDLKSNPILFFVTAVILAPLLETLIFQKFIIIGTHKVLLKLKCEGFIIPIIISTLVFGIQHLYSIRYLICGLFVGYLLALTFVLLYKNKQRSFFITAIIHSIVNLIAFLMEFVFKN